MSYHDRRDDPAFASRTYIANPGTKIDKEIQQIFDTLHIKTEPSNAGAEIDRKLEELTDVVNQLRDSHNRLHAAVIHDAETKDDVVEGLNKWDDDEEDDLELEPGWTEATEYDVADSDLAGDGSLASAADAAGEFEPGGSIASSSHPPSKSEREMVDEAVREVLTSTKSTLEAAIAQGQEKFEEALEKGEEYLYDGIQQALEHLKEVVRPPSRRSDSEGGETPCA